MRLNLFSPLLLAIGIGVALCTTQTAAAGTIWYSGDADGNDGFSNVVIGSSIQGTVYSNFVVSGSGLTVTGLFSNDVMNFIGTTSAQWSIVSGMSAGNPGTVIASGTSVASQTPTGRTPLGLTEYTISVSGLNVSIGPGEYWFNVTPVDPGADTSDFSFQTTTSGANSIGIPVSFNSDPFVSYSDVSFPAGDLSFAPATSQAPDLIAFSGGVVAADNTATTPEPASLVTLAIGAAGLWLARRRRRRAAGC